MITSENFKEALRIMKFKTGDGIFYEKSFPDFGIVLKVDTQTQKLYYPSSIKGGERNDFYDDSHKENLVVFECVNRLLAKGYRPEDIELEKVWHLGHDAKGGRADICVTDYTGKMLFIIECKTYGREYQNEYKNTLNDGGQLFSYWQQEGSCKWLVLYASKIADNQIEWIADSIDCSDDNNILASAKKDITLKLYRDAHTVNELFEVWDETYEKRFCGDVVFREDTKAYQIGVKPLRKKELKDFSENDKIVNRFEEILRHNNVSDKENAFNRLIALFICKLVDEIQKTENDEVEFQYKVGTDTYESLQDRFQRLHKEGMEKFMREEIFYVSDTYAEELVTQYTGHKRQKMIEDLRRTLRILKFYTNNDFAFKDVHNEELFYQNGKIVVEVVQLFERYRIIGSNDIQMLGDLFEQLLNKGFKQNEGQFFTPIPITRFIWNSLPLEELIHKINVTEYPKIIDYACGAGHFLTEGFEAVNDCIKRIDPSVEISSSWVENKMYGIEKDYRLARVSKISLFMHGAGEGNIIFGDGLENYKEKNIVPNTFDILVANPPYSVSAFKPHLRLKDNEFTIFPKISNSGSEIETLFVERIAQLVKPEGVAAVVLPSSILNKESESFIAARTSILENFYIRAIAQFGSKTFGATGTNTVILFLEKYSEPPKRKDMVDDSIQAIFAKRSLIGWEDQEIINQYLGKIGVDSNTYGSYIRRELDYIEWRNVPYFSQYVRAFKTSSECIAKEKQKNFSKISEEEKLVWYNQHFYDFIDKIEVDKLTYFALCYRQNTLIVVAPEDNKEQEKFLGYRWSNRKGQEGIQMISQGGTLYNEADRTDDNKIAGIIRNMFYQKQYYVTDLQEYYYYLRLQDMMDFSGVDFNKVIKITRSRDTLLKAGMTRYKLNSSDFDIGIGNRVLSTDLIEDGLYPVYSANVFEEFGRINKQNITDFSKASIIWGIDGDWMVNYIPANKPFYPTDHCGVIRINTDEILPQYLTIALRIEGEHEKFSRTNRASTQRIKNLTIQVPQRKIQQNIIDEISAINQEIDKEERIIFKFIEDVKEKFVEMFEKNTDAKKWDIQYFEDICDIITDGEHNTPKRTNKGIYLLSARNILNHELQLEDVDYIDENEYNRISCRIIPQVGDVLISCSGTVGRCCAIHQNIKFQMVRSVALLRFKKEINPFFAEYLILSDNLQKQIKQSITQQAQPNLFQGKIKRLYGLVPPIELQNKFATYAKSIDKLKSDANDRKNQYLKQREELITKYFK